MPSGATPKRCPLLRLRHQWPCRLSRRRYCHLAAKVPDLRLRCFLPKHRTKRRAAGARSLQQRMRGRLPTICWTARCQGPGRSRRLSEAVFPRKLLLVLYLLPRPLSMLLTTRTWQGPENPSLQALPHHRRRWSQLQRKVLQLSKCRRQLKQQLPQCPQRHLWLPLRLPCGHLARSRQLSRCHPRGRSLHSPRPRLPPPPGLQRCASGRKWRRGPLGTAACQLAAPRRARSRRSGALGGRVTGQQHRREAPGLSIRQLKEQPLC